MMYLDVNFILFILLKFLGLPDYMDLRPSSILENIRPVYLFILPVPYPLYSLLL